MNMIYFVSDQFNYAKTISPAYGRPFANDYGWQTSSIKDLSSASPDIAIIDNRITESEFAEVRKFVENMGVRQRVLFKLHDPYIEHSSGYSYYKFIQTLRDDGRLNFITVYPPCEYLGFLFSLFPRAKFIHAPYLYEQGKELPLSHSRRKKKVLLSGARDQRIYPIRHQALVARYFNPMFRVMSEDLPHPGYPDIGHVQTHATIGARYVERLSEFSFALCCSSRDRIEFLKYREIAYAGAAPVGDLPATFSDCPSDAYVGWRRNHLKLSLSLIQADAQAIAHRFRVYMRKKRDQSKMRAQVYEAISRL